MPKPFFFAATSALDAESETLVNQALAALLRGNNTTISIAHRLSTIKRSDSIIVLSSDGKVAQQGSYDALSKQEGGAFRELMEWQMSGGETDEGKGRGKVVSKDDHEDIIASMAEDHAEDEGEEEEDVPGTAGAARLEGGAVEGEERDGK